MKLNKGKIKNLNKLAVIGKKKVFENLNTKRGSETVEMIIITTISLVLIVSILYPAITMQMQEAVAQLQEWFNSAFVTVGIV